MKPVLLFGLLFSFTITFSQNNTDKIKVRKTDSEFYFFQQGRKSDTISSNSNLFVMQIPKSKRCTYKIEIQNGQLLKTKNDTVFKLVKLNNLNYIHYYSDTLTTMKNSNAPDKCSKYTVAIDGANNLNTPNIIRIRFVNSFNDSTILINKFYYK
jgi:hypothetical protein